MATCLYPLRLPYAIVPCGRCNICRHNRGADWVTRLILESQLSYKAMYFMTLTYKRAPVSGVSKKDLQLFFRRVRKKCKVRFFAVGEYGERYGRPHYHVIIFQKTGTLEDLVTSWKLGHVDVGNVTPKSCAYVAGYAVKGSRWPVIKNKPFALMSRKPGIGADHLIPSMRKYYLETLDTRVFDGKQFRRMPRYFRKKLFNDVDAKLIAERNTEKHLKAEKELIRKLTKLKYRDPVKEIHLRKVAFNHYLKLKKTKKL